MRLNKWLGSLAATLVLISPLAVSAQSASPAYDDLGRALEELAGQLHGLGECFRTQLGAGDMPAERPIITAMLDHSQELGLTPAQVQTLERIRAEFQRDATKLDADQRAAQTNLASLLRTEPVNLDKAEAGIREIERLRADVRIGRIRAIEQGKAQLTAEQRAKLDALIAEPRSRSPRAGGRPVPPRL